MKTEDIKQFLVEANHNGYGNELVKEVNEADGSHTITYDGDDWLFHDNFFGGEPFGGREVIFYKNKPVWMMVYYGSITNPQPGVKEIYTFLKKALLNFTDDLPYRGPKELIDGDWRYENKVEGEFENFSGEELIRYKNEIVYTAKYQGGSVDR